MSALIVRSIKVEDYTGTMDDIGFGGFTAKVSVNGNFLGFDFEEEFLVSKAIKSNDSIAVKYSKSLGRELSNAESAKLKKVKEWIKENLKKVQTIGLTKSGQWVNQ